MSEVGRVTSHFRPTLSVVLPDWIEEQKAHSARLLRRWFQPVTATLAPVKHDVNDAEYKEIPAWFAREGFLPFLLLFERLQERGGSDSGRALLVLSKEVEAAAPGLEHFLNFLIADQGASVPQGLKHSTLLPKLYWLWGDTPVAAELKQRRALTRTADATPFANQRLEIGKVQLDPQWGVVTRYTLEAVLIRNYGQHRGLRECEREELFEHLRSVLGATVLAWKHARLRGFL